MGKKTQWGLSVPKVILKEKGDPRSFWGARAIFNKGCTDSVELVSDRQFFMPENALYPLLLDWVHEKGLPLLQKHFGTPQAAEGDSAFELSQIMYGMTARQRAGYVHIGAWRYDTKRFQYELAKPDPTAKWMGKFPIPNPGDRVFITMNGFGPATVIDYTVGDGYQGVRVKPDRLPEWFVKQNPYTVTGTFYGAEMTPLPIPAISNSA